MTAPLSPRAVVRPGGQALGTWVKLAAPEPTEILAHAGFDFVVVDMEHAPLSLETVYRLVNSASANGMVPFVRVPDHSPALIQKVLDAGAHGLFVPRVDSLAEAEAIARAFSFPPEGIRGAGGTSRAGLWGLRSTAEYLDFGRTQAMLVVQLESASGIADAARIAALPAVSALFVGAADLSLSLGETTGSPRVRDCIAAARAAAAEAGKAFGLAFGPAPEAARAAFAEGTDFVLSGNDATLLASAAVRLVSAVREEAG
ncbi:aldolase/citrate lyase family protein [Amycolatopsis rhabdoformis]|uniref:Aldolase/citrate lyase family protein n=1 Tax=Amycolatopsis rhabdoformis TaxID=1448059 RepID=A0ABZ1IDX2_9PSEU|nr:aldolase/citrate lyase family protein [Amycolatopsis rhabdoformis]WSE32467.1 aldolase/citrate lyase family protein [Amycolatopsis rhabdoformis]